MTEVDLGNLADASLEDIRAKFSSALAGLNSPSVFELTQIALMYEQKLKEQQAQIASLNTRVITDGPTGLYNKDHFRATLAARCDESSRYGNPFSLICIDADNFRDVNNRISHDAGDYIIKELARVLAQRARRSDVVARWGGDEFAVILPGTDLSHAYKASERFRSGVEKNRFVYRTHNGTLEELTKKTQGTRFIAKGSGIFVPVTITCSVGQHIKGEAPDEFYNRVDMLSAGKPQGKNKTYGFTPRVTDPAISRSTDPQINPIEPV